MALAAAAEAAAGPGGLNRGVVGGDGGTYMVLVCLLSFPPSLPSYRLLILCASPHTLIGGMNNDTLEGVPKYEEEVSAVERELDAARPKQQTS
jgi:hypothetical protein